jgi:hypothetical protein
MAISIMANNGNEIINVESEENNNSEIIAGVA